MKHRLGKLCLSALCTAWAAQTAAFEVQSGFELIRDPDTTITGLHRFYVGYDMGKGFSLGQAIYSAAKGDAGGAFFWGYEAVKEWSLGERLSLVASGFIGGGGGASQVVGDGLMLRLSLGLGFRVNEHLDLTAGMSRMGIDGGDEDATALSFGVSYSADPSTAVAERLSLRSVALQVVQSSYVGAETRSGVPQSDLSLVGANFDFFGGPTGEWYVEAAGAAHGGEGYMQLLGGLRRRVSLGITTGIVESAAGFGGGGDVDAGGGPLARVGLGFALPVADGLDVEFALSRQIFLDSGVAGTAALLRFAHVFHHEASERADTAAYGQEWQFSTGVTQQFPNASFRKDPGAPNGRPLMQETSLDLFMTDWLYLTGNAQTVLGGDAAGYAIGLVGLGYSARLTPRLAWAVEGLVGAAGGGSVAAEGGAVVGLRGEIDYKVTPGLLASIAIGQYVTLDGGGMGPRFVNVGIKIPFSTK